MAGNYVMLALILAMVGLYVYAAITANKVTSFGEETLAVVLYTTETIVTLGTTMDRSRRMIKNEFVLYKTTDNQILKSILMTSSHEYVLVPGDVIKVRYEESNPETVVFVDGPYKTLDLEEEMWYLQEMLSTLSK